MENTTVSIIALTVSFLSLGWQAISWRKQHRQQRLGQNLALLANVKMKLSEIPDGFRFHGISKQELEECGINEKELSYLVANFMAGQIYHESNVKDPNEPFPETEYRSQMCKTKDFQKAWPLLKRLLDNTSYKRKIERTINHYQNIEQKQSKSIQKDNKN